MCVQIPLQSLFPHCTKKMMFSIKNFSSKCDRIHRKLRISSHLLEKSLMGNVIFVKCQHLISIPYLPIIIEDIKTMPIDTGVCQSAVDSIITNPSVHFAGHQEIEKQYCLRFVKDLKSNCGAKKLFLNYTNAICNTFCSKSRDSPWQVFCKTSMTAHVIVCSLSIDAVL